MSLRPLLVPILLALLGGAALTIDIPVERWFEAGREGGALKKLFDLDEVFGHGTGVAVILLSVLILAPQLRWKVPRVIACAYLSGLVAISMKLFVARKRPYAASIDSIGSVRETFDQWFPWFSTKSALQSFVSGHTATAVGLALGLSWLLPRGKWLFAVLAVLVGLQRMASQNHFPSDVLWGAAIGWLIASACLPGGWLSGPFDRLERRST
jgi:membrane-associated phospholipid phosphatase